MAKVSKSSDNDMDDYRAESDHSTLTRAEEIKSDSGRMRGVKKHHAKQMKAFGKVGKSFKGNR